MSESGLFEAGEVLAGRYRVEGVLGAGGFGVVLRATHLAIEHPVAIKALRPELLTNERALKRFLREAQLARRLEHPNTVRLLDLGQTADGAPFLVFELLTGRTLEAVIDGEGSLAPARVARIATQILKSLMDAHGHQVVHRDIKPANVFLCDFPGESDFVKVLDFGIAKGLDGTALGFTTLTRPGSLFGTPNYIAPECVRGGPVTPRADLYALGLVMAEMLSGEVVVKGTNVVAICSILLDDAPLELPGPVKASPFGEVIARAIEKDPARRFASAGEMLQAIERALAAPAPAPWLASAPTSPAIAAPTSVPSGSSPATAPPAAAPAPAPPTVLAVTAPYVGARGPAPRVAVSPLPAATGAQALPAPRRLFPVAIVATLLVAVAIGTATGALIVSARRAPQAHHRAAAPVPVAPVPVAPVPVAPAPVPGSSAPASLGLADLSPALIRQRLEREGHRVVEAVARTYTGPCTHDLLRVSTNGGLAGSVTLYTCVDPGMASYVATGLGERQAGGRVVREGPRVLVVVVVGQSDPAMADRLVDAILARRP